MALDPLSAAAADAAVAATAAATASAAAATAAAAAPTAAAAALAGPLSPPPPPPPAAAASGSGASGAPVARSNAAGKARAVEHTPTDMPPPAAATTEPEEAHTYLSLSASAAAVATGETDVAVQAMEEARDFDDLATAVLAAEPLLQLQGVEYGADACKAHMERLLQEGERLLLLWPVVSVNEWGTQQRRVLALSSKALYRLHYRLDQRKVDHHSSVSLGDLRCIERGRLGYKGHLTVPDGRENPLSWAFSAAVPSSQLHQVAKGDARYEKVYYPCAADDVALAPLIELSIGAIDHANRLVAEQAAGQAAGQGRVTRCEVTEFVPQLSSLDKLADQLVEAVGPAIESTRGRVAPLVAAGRERAGSGAAVAYGKLKGAWASLTTR